MTDGLRLRALAPAILAAAFILSMLAAQTVLANGGTVQVSNAAAGPYQLSVFTSPSPIRVGTVDVSVLVQRAESTEVVDGVAVAVQVEPAGGQVGGGTYEATRERATNKLFYAADVSLPAEGRWRMRVAADGPDGSGSVAFEVEATREAAPGSPLLMAGIVAAPALLVLGWLLRRSGRAG